MSQVHVGEAIDDIEQYRISRDLFPIFSVSVNSRAQEENFEITIRCLQPSASAPNLPTLVQLAYLGPT